MEKLLKDAKHFYERRTVDTEAFRHRFYNNVRLHQQVKSKRNHHPKLIAIVVFFINLLIPYGNPICRSMGF